MRPQTWMSASAEDACVRPSEDLRPRRVAMSQVSILQVHKSSMSQFAIGAAFPIEAPGSQRERECQREWEAESERERERLGKNE